MPDRATTSRHFAHDPWVWEAFPALRATAAVVALPDDAEALTPLRTAAAEHLAAVVGRPDRAPESSLAPVAAWRAVFAATGVRPTQYRCAAESLLRRLRTHGSLPELHPLVDLGNALSVRWAVPVAVIDLERVSGSLCVRRSSGVEEHTTFTGDVEHPAPGEVAYVDDAGHAHSRRWCWRQSARSVIGSQTRLALVVAEAVHGDAERDVLALGEQLAVALAAVGVAAEPALLARDAPALGLP